MNKKVFSAFLLAVVALMCDRAKAQSTVVGGQGTYIYVNGQTGSNSNAGTSATAAFQTIQAGINKALTNNKSGIATVVSIAPGVYHEAVTLTSKKNAAIITVQAATPGTAYIDAADVLTGATALGSNIWEYSWTDSVNGCPLPSGWYTGMPPVVLANEMVVINGAPLTQVMSASQLVPGTFFVNSSYKELEVDPPTGTNMSTAQVEVSNRRSTFSMSGVSNVVITGLVFEHAASCINTDGATIGSSSNILINNVQANWNNWGGLAVNGTTDLTVENSTGSYNGGVGLSGFEDVSALWQNNETDYNNWRGEMVGLYDFAQGGVKLMHAHTATVSGQMSYNNGAEGLWFDTDNMNVNITGASLVGNLVDNLQLEANEGPFTVANSSFCSSNVGINLINTAGVTLSGNHFYANGGTINAQNAQIFLAGNPGGRIVKNFQTGASTNVYTSSAKFQNNSVTGVGSGQYVFNTYLSGNDWSEFINSLSSSGNDWYNASNLTDFTLPGGKHDSFATWQTTAHDTTSAWVLSSAAQGNCAVPLAAYPDFTVMAHNAASYVSSYKMSSGNVSIPLQIRSFNYGTIQLSASGLPAGVTATFSSPSLVSGNSTLTLTASSSATAQTVPITIFAISGSRVHTLTLWVAIS